MVAHKKTLGPTLRQSSTPAQTLFPTSLQLQARPTATHPLAQAQAVSTRRTKRSGSSTAFQAQAIITVLALAITAQANASQTIMFLMIPEPWTSNGTIDRIAQNMVRY